MRYRRNHQRRNTLSVLQHSGILGLRPYPNALQFIVNEGYKVQVLVVAGVGSSVVGTAALARSLSNHYQRDVAGIVSGYGMADVVLKGLSGWYFYGMIDQVRYDIETFVTDMSTAISKSFSKGTNGKGYLDYFALPLDAYVPSDLDVSALHDILVYRYLHFGRKEMQLELLVGHSKGNLLISSALNNMCQELEGMKANKEVSSYDSFNDLSVVTFGAVVNIPEPIIERENLHQFLGSLDLLGRLNSRSVLGYIRGAQSIPGAAHHLNTKIPFYMDVGAVLDEYSVKLPAILPQDGDGDLLALRRRDMAALASTRSPQYAAAH